MLIQKPGSKGKSYMGEGYRSQCRGFKQMKWWICFLLSWEIVHEILFNRLYSLRFFPAQMWGLLNRCWVSLQSDSDRIQYCSSSVRGDASRDVVLISFVFLIEDWPKTLFPSVWVKPIERKMKTENKSAKGFFIRQNRRKNPQTLSSGILKRP